MIRIRSSIGAFAFAIVAARLGAQTPDTTASPPANPADVASPDAIVKALYDVISGPAGQKRDWTRFRSLFIPGARLIPSGMQADGSAHPRVMSPSDYAGTVAANMERTGFFEREVSRHADRYGAMMQLFSTYESRRAASDPAPFARGINSIQLLNDGSRWWVVTVYWVSERPNTPIPPEFLAKP